MAFVFATSLLAVACTAGGGSGRSARVSESPDDSHRSPPSGELTIFAAASLTEVYGDIATSFEHDYPNVDVVLNFAGSQSLRTQIEHGATPQLFASANQKHIDKLLDLGMIDESTIFAENQMVIVVPASNPGHVESLDDLATTSHVVLAGSDVPAGSYAEKVLAKADSARGDDFASKVLDNVVSRELDVRSTLQKVVLGEANAAMVYATDAASVGDKVKVIRIPEELNVIAEYPIAKINGSGKGRLGQLFIEYLGSETGRAALEAHGFRTIP